jgi:hypothetical protein
LGTAAAEGSNANRGPEAAPAIHSISNAARGIGTARGASTKGRGSGSARGKASR